jgi:general secretion pathway protein H
VLRLDFEARRYGVPGADGGGSWSEDYRLEAVVASRDVTDDRRASIRYYPDGSSTGGSIRVQRPNGDGVRLRVDWLTGRVTQEPLAIDE